MDVPTRSSSAWLAASGLASAVITVLTDLNTRTFYYTGGLIFGAMISVYFALYEGYRRPINLLLFVSACTASLPASVVAAFEGLLFFHSFTASQSAGIPLSVFALAGGAGGFLVLAAALLMFGPREADRSSLVRILTWSIGASVLGLAGGMADHFFVHRPNRDFSAVVLIWQPGMALLMGIMLQRERSFRGARLEAISEREVAGTPVNRGGMGLAAIFLSCVLGFLGFLLVRTIESNTDSQRRRAAYKRSIAETPSTANLPPIEPLPLEQALILHDIGALYAGSPLSSRTFPFPSINSSGAAGLFEMQYTLGYMATSNAPPPPASIRRVVAILVIQLPNEEWSRYYTKYPPSQSILAYSPGDLTSIKKYGQTVVQDSIQRYPNGDGTLCFRWPSINFAISVCYETREVDEEFLRQYLEKYPSSLQRTGDAPQAMKNSNFTSYVHTAISNSPIRARLRNADAVVLERIARGGGATQWYHCRDESAIELIATQFRPGSVISFYFDKRILDEEYSLQTKQKIRKLVTETGEVIVGTVHDESARIAMQIVTGMEELEELLAAWNSTSRVFYGLFPARDNDGINAITIEFPDTDGIVRSHPH